MTPAKPPVNISDLRVFQLEPNLTAILPGMCQARCHFCLEPEGPPPASYESWVAAFKELMDQLPPLFRLLSISGGEPTLSPVFGKLLNILLPLRKSDRFKRVVLTTNGGLSRHGTTSLTRYIDALSEAVTHVNISRHAVDDTLNARVFKREWIPGDKEVIPTGAGLASLIELLNQCGITVNLNCVYSSEEAFGRRLHGVPPDELREELRADAHHFIGFARNIGASSVTFRHDHSDPHLDQPTALEEAFDGVQTVHEAHCASCRVIGKLISGIAVNFKRSAYEPISLHGEDELYEMVFHSNGILYQDWSRRYPIEMPLPHRTPTADCEQLRAKRMQASWSNYLGLATAECDQRQQTCNLM